MSITPSISKTATSRALATYPGHVLSQQGNHVPVENPGLTQQLPTAPMLFRQKNFWWGVGFSIVGTAISHAVLKAEHSTKQLEKHLQVLQSKIKLKSKSKDVAIDSGVNWFLSVCSGGFFVASGVSSFLEGKKVGKLTGITAWDKDNRTFIRGWKHGFSHSLAGLEKYQDSRDRLNLSVERHLLADKARASLLQPRPPHFGSTGPELPKASFLERLKKLSTATRWLEWGSWSAAALLGYGFLKKNQLNGLKKQIKVLQYRLQAMQKKEEKVFLHGIATLGIAAVSIPLSRLLEPFWSKLGYKHGYVKGLHNPDAEELSFRTGFVLGITDPAAKPDPALVTVTEQEKSWAIRALLDLL